MIDLVPPSFGDGTPAPELAPNPKALLEVLAADPRSIEIHNVKLLPAIESVRRAAVLEAIERLEAARAEAGTLQLVAAPAAIPEPFVPSQRIASTPLPWVDKWAAPAKRARTATMFAASPSRPLGLGVLALIAIIVLGYFATAAFFCVNHSWIVPTGAASAMVPDDNLDNVAQGAPVYGCRLGTVLCHEVGSVLGVLPGEVGFLHPHRNVQLHGRRVTLQLTDRAAVEHDVLFVGRAPLWL